MHRQMLDDALGDGSGADFFAFEWLGDPCAAAFDSAVDSVDLN